MDVITENKVVPNLRFGEYVDEWKHLKLGDIGQVKMCKRIMKHQTTQIGDIPFFKIGTFGKKANSFIDSNLFEEYKSKYSYPKKGDILIAAAGATYGKKVVFDGYPSYFQDSNIVWLENNEQVVSNKFLYHCYTNIKWAIESSTIPRLYNTIILYTKIFAPSISEQQKIASFLSAVDKKLQQLTKKKELLAAYKKGVMQKIFSQELRFKDDNGNNYPNWDEKKLGDCIVSNKKSQTQVNEVSKNDRNKINQFPFFTSGERLFYSKEYLIKNENIFMSTGGKATVKYYNGQCSYSTDTYSFTTNNQYSVGFIFFFLQNIIKKIESQYFYGSGLKHLDKKGIVKYKLSVPTLNEQKKIANFLSSIDIKIELVSTQIDNTKAFKKGLLQQMFV